MVSIASTTPTRVGAYSIVDSCAEKTCMVNFGPNSSRIGCERKVAGEDIEMKGKAYV
jgi:hypothetical protein